MYVAICEDNPQDMDVLKTAVENIVRNQNLEFQIITFTNGDDFLHYVGNNGVPAISFLDIYLGGVNGLDIGKKIRQESERAAIIFSAKSKEHMAQGWDIGAVHYLVKPYSAEKVAQAMQRALLMVSKPERYLTFSVNRRKRRCFFHRLSILNPVTSIAISLRRMKNTRCSQSYQSWRNSWTMRVFYAVIKVLLTIRCGERRQSQA